MLQAQMDLARFAICSDEHLRLTLNRRRVKDPESLDWFLPHVLGFPHQPVQPFCRCQLPAETTFQHKFA